MEAKPETQPAHILTAELDADSFAFLTELRRAHFPPQRNYLDAHLTLFHALPLESLSEVRNSVALITRGAPLAFEWGRWYSLGRGVAMEIRAPELSQLRELWRLRWIDFLGQQDRAQKRLHVTVQNKVDAATARETLRNLETASMPAPGRVKGFALYRYEQGPWRLLERWDFGA